MPHMVKTCAVYQTRILQSRKITLVTQSPNGAPRRHRSIMGSNPIEAWNFQRLFFSGLFNVHNRDGFSYCMIFLACHVLRMMYYARKWHIYFICHVLLPTLKCVQANSRTRKFPRKSRLEYWCLHFRAFRVFCFRSTVIVTNMLKKTVTMLEKTTRPFLPGRFPHVRNVAMPLSKVYCLRLK